MPPTTPRAPAVLLRLADVTALDDLDDAPALRAALGLAGIDATGTPAARLLGADIRGQHGAAPRPLLQALRGAQSALGAWGALAAEEPDGSGDATDRAAADLIGRLYRAIPAALPPGLDAYLPLLRRLDTGQPLDADASHFTDEAATLWARPGFETLVSLPRLRFQPFPHQLAAARTVLARMRGRAILADEVGLGKTIEAGLVLSELYLRGLCPRTLILVPAGLVGQWAEELDRKFALPCAVWGGDPAGDARFGNGDLAPATAAGAERLQAGQRGAVPTLPPLAATAEEVAAASAPGGGGRGSGHSSRLAPTHHGADGDAAPGDRQGATAMDEAAAAGPTGARSTLLEQAREGAPILLISLAAARRAPLREALAGEAWDLVIVDEAHRVKNPQTASARLVKSLRARYLLLLTATPVENRLDDLFQLANLVRPGHLGTSAEFRQRHGTAATAQGVREVEGLQARTRDLMVRHRRSEVALMLPRRLAETVRVVPGAEEADLYRQVSARVRERARQASTRDGFTLRHVQRVAGSSPAALAPALQHLGWDDLAQRAAAAPVPEKARVLVEVLRRHLARQEKVVVFTAFRGTLDMLAGLVAEAGVPAARYHGSLGRREKDAAVRTFQGAAPLLLTTEAAGEGRNLQFCHTMVNFDLPWNPMQIEQRLGRIHRIGQTQDVVLTNLVTRGTVEERILEVLEAKINLFELVVGELDMILGRVQDDFDFEAFLFKAHVESGDDAEFAARLELLGTQLAEARREYLGSRALGDLLVPETDRAAADAASRAGARA